MVIVGGLEQHLEPQHGCIASNCQLSGSRLTSPKDGNSLVTAGGRSLEGATEVLRAEHATYATRGPHSSKNDGSASVKNHVFESITPST